MRLLVFLIVLFVSLPCLAQETDAPARVVVSPTIYVAGDDPALVSLAAQALHRGIERELRANTTFDLVDASELTALVQARPAYQESIKLAQSWAELGITKYKELDAEGAVKSLEQAYAIFNSVRWSFVEPLKMAEVIMYLALAHLDLRRDLARPLELMAEMIRLDPTRVLRAGFYPEDVVQFYNSARETVERDVEAGGDVSKRAPTRGSRPMCAMSSSQMCCNGPAALRSCCSGTTASLARFSPWSLWMLYRLSRPECTRREAA
ncbi:MAG: hypothetical protein R3E66_02490 [bacterium]